MSERNQESFDLSSVELKMPEEDFLEAEPKSKSISLLPIMLLLIIILLLVTLGGLIWWGKELIKTTPPEEILPTTTRPTREANDEPESTTAEAQVQAINTLSSSDKLGDIAADLQATAVTDLTPEITTIDNLLLEELESD